MIVLKTNRRRLLQKMVASSASLPFLSYMPSLGAQESARKRLLLMFSPNGTIGSEFFPSGNGNNFQLKRILQPLESLKSELLILKGMQNRISGVGDAHARGIVGLWTGAELLAANTLPGQEDAEEGLAFAAGPSVDQVIAPTASQGLRFRSLEYGVKVVRNDATARMIYAGRNRPIEPERNPYDAFDRLYGDFNAGSAEQAALRDKNLRLKSVLDAVTRDMTRVRPFLSAEDKVKLERHTDSVRDIERALQAPDDSDLVCQVPNRDTRNITRFNDNRHVEKLGRLFIDMMVSSFACNRTAVASLQYSQAFGNIGYPHIDEDGNHHARSHAPDSDAGIKERLIKTNAWYAGEFAYLVQSLKDTPDPSGNGSLLDNSFAIWGNELGKGNSHSRSDIPFVSAGSCQGYFRTGRYIQQSSQTNHAQLLVSMLNAFGLQQNGIGEFNNVGPLADLT